MDKKSLLESWDMFRREHAGVSVDRMICDPQLRQAFLSSIGKFAGANEGEVLWKLMGLRKRKELSKE
ncbi:MAG: hypothetical protein ABL921_07705 [Pirellula sp.]